MVVYFLEFAGHVAVSCGKKTYESVNIFALLHGALVFCGIHRLC